MTLLRWAVDTVTSRGAETIKKMVEKKKKEEREREREREKKHREKEWMKRTRNLSDGLRESPKLG